MSEKPRIRVNRHGIVAADGFSNIAVGLGAANPKMQQVAYGVSSDVQQADMAFRTSTWYGKILTIPVDDAVREWRDWKADESQIELLEAEEKRLSYRMVAREALMVARHEGGALVVPGGLPGSLSSPLDLDRVGQGSVKFLTVLSRHDVTPGPIVRDPMSPLHGRPEWWGFAGANGEQLRVHASRAVPINGRRVPGSMLRSMEFWGDSIWLHLSDAVIAADSGHAIVTSLLHEAKLDVVTIPDMANMLSTPEGSAALTRRWQLANQLKSIASILLLDGGPQVAEGTAQSETWAQKQIRWDGLPDVVRVLLTVLSGAADIPYTRLTGDQQKGLSNNDDGSLRNYYASVNTRQVLEIEPMLAPLDEILIRSALGTRPPDVWYTWRPLWQMTERERAEIRKLEAEEEKIVADMALLDADKLALMQANRMVESGRWPGAGPDAVADDPGTPYAPPPTPTPGGPLAGAGARPGSAGRDASAGDAAPRPLYVSRSVLNAAEIVAHYRKQGVPTTLPPDDLHVTVAFSRTPIDWMSVPEPWEGQLDLPAGGPRMNDTLGSARVLLFRSRELEWRNEMIRELGASWDHEAYHPHITITYGELPESVQPWQGRIVLGPEVFAPVTEDWADRVEEVS